MSILFIGGASGSGKSYTTSKISENLKVSVLELDFIYRIISKHLNAEFRGKVTEILAFEIVSYGAVHAR